jgi:hypothetical protein
MDKFKQLKDDEDNDFEPKPPLPPSAPGVVDKSSSSTDDPFGLVLAKSASMFMGSKVKATATTNKKKVATEVDVMSIFSGKIMGFV